MSVSDAGVLLTRCYGAYGRHEVVQVAVGDSAEIEFLKKEWLAGCEGFNRKDVSAWMNPFHADAVTFNDGFMPLSAIRPMAPDIIAASKSFNTANVEGRIVNDTAILFGDFQYDMEDGGSTAGAFTATFARADGAWTILLTHYTPR